MTAKLTIKGRPAASYAAERHESTIDDAALLRWACVALEVMEGMQAYVPLRTRWTQMDLWLKRNESDPRWPERKQKARELWMRILAPGAMFDDIAHMIDRLHRAWTQLSDAAKQTLIRDYGVDFKTVDHPFLVNLFMDREIADLNDLLDSWALAKGGHAKERKETEECPF